MQKDNLEYLGFQITKQGITPLPDEVQTIKHIANKILKRYVETHIGYFNSFN